MLTHFYLVFQVEISGNAFLANLGPFILKIFRGSMPLDPLEGQKFSSQLRGSETFLGQAMPPPPNCIKGFPDIKKAAENLVIVERFPGGGGGQNPPPVR